MNSDRTPLPMPVFDFFNWPVEKDLVEAVTKRGGYQILARRREILIGNGFGDAEDLIASLQDLHRYAPDARLLVHFKFWPGRSWILRHGETDTYLSPNRTHALTGKTMSAGNVPPEKLREPGVDIFRTLTKPYDEMRPSPFSERFAKDMADFIRSFFERIQKEAFRARLHAAFVGAYACGEWNLGAPTPDHSACALHYFRRYLREHYADEAALREAWDRPDITFDNALPPEQFANPVLGHLAYLDGPMYDYRKAIARAISDQLLTVVKACRDYAPDLALGCFWPNCFHGHQADMARVIDALDFTGTPLAYYNRQAGAAACSQSPLPQSGRCRGRVFLDEVDCRTHLSSSMESPFGPAATSEEAADMLWRDLVAPLVRTNATWCLDFAWRGLCFEKAEPGTVFGSLHTTPALLDTHKQINALWANKPHIDLAPVESVKVFTPFRHTITQHNSSTYDALFPNRHQFADEFSRAGIMVEYFSIEDLIETRVSLGKLNVFCSCAQIENHEANALKDIVQGSGTVCLWINGAALLTPGEKPNPDTGRSVEITGIQQRIIHEPQPTVHFGTYVRSADLPLTYIQGSELFGQLERAIVTFDHPRYSRLTPQPPLPFPQPYRIAVEDPDGQELGRFLEHGEVCWAIKKTRGFTSIVYNLPILPARLLRAMAAYAGVHVYVDRDDMILAARGILLHHACVGGPFDLRFPAAQDLFDVRTGTFAARNTDRIPLNAPRGKTTVFLPKP